jgi:hypothetical protein
MCCGERSKREKKIEGIDERIKDTGGREGREWRPKRRSKDARRGKSKDGDKGKKRGSRGPGEHTSCSCSIALYNSPAVIALDLGGIICEERLLGGEGLTPERRMDERRFGILVGEEDGPSAILFEGADGVASKAWGLGRSLEGKRRKRIVDRGGNGWPRVLAWTVLVLADGGEAIHGFTLIWFEPAGGGLGTLEHIDYGCISLQSEDMGSVSSIS